MRRTANQRALPFGHLEAQVSTRITEVALLLVHLSAVHLLAVRPAACLEVPGLQTLGSETLAEVTAMATILATELTLAMATETMARSRRFSDCFKTPVCVELTYTARTTTI